MPDDIKDPHNIAIACYVNDELRQSSNTNDLIYNCFEQIAYLSTAFTLELRDIIATGTQPALVSQWTRRSFCPSAMWSVARSRAWAI